MAKLKTKKGVVKRFRQTKRGKITYHSGGKSHLASCKKSKRIRRLRRTAILGDAAKEKYVKRMLPYGRQ